VTEAGETAAGCLPAKLSPPGARVRTVERRTLLDALGRTTEPLVVLCAPAGTGKTTALRQWIERDGGPAAWVQIDEADADPVVLLIYLTRALSAVVDLDPAVEPALQVGVPPLRERIMPLLGEALAAAPPFTLVLDDAHLLGDSRAWDVVDFTLRGLPSGARLALGTRSDPPLHLARLRAAGELAEFGAHELSFDRDETVEMLRLHGIAIGEDDVDALIAAT